MVGVCAGTKDNSLLATPLPKTPNQSKQNKHQGVGKIHSERLFLLTKHWLSHSTNMGATGTSERGAMCCEGNKRVWKELQTELHHEEGQRLAEGKPTLASC